MAASVGRHYPVDVIDLGKIIRLFFLANCQNLEKEGISLDAVGLRMVIKYSMW